MRVIDVLIPIEVEITSEFIRQTNKEQESVQHHFFKRFYICDA